MEDNKIPILEELAYDVERNKDIARYAYATAKGVRVVTVLATELQKGIDFLKNDIKKREVDIEDIVPLDFEVNSISAGIKRRILYI